MYKVVVVEDERLVRQGIIMETEWSLVDCVVVGEADNGEDGYAMIKKYSPDLVITDIRMPKKTGLEMMEQLKQEDITPYVIFLTAYDDFTYAQQAIRLNTVDYLLKPFKDGQLEETIRTLLKNSQKRREAERDKNPELQLKKGDKSKYIVDAIAYIDENYANPDLSVKAVADHLRISEGHLSHLFRKETNFTVMAYVTNCRIKAARNLLKDYKYKVYEVAEMVGYRDITYFGMTFKKHVEVTPSEYQDRYR